jgi:GGDEF domain-containing protein
VPRQKYPFGIITSAITAICYIFIAYLRGSSGFFAFVSDTANIKLPALFVIIGYYLSLIREGYDYELSALMRKNSALEKQMGEVREINSGINEEDRKNALKIFETSTTIKTVYNAASSLASFDEDELIGSLCDLVQKFCDSKAFVLYKIVEGTKLIITAERIDDKFADSFDFVANVNDDALIAESYTSGKIYTMLDIIDKNMKHVIKSDVKISCPIKFKDDGEIYGFIVLYDLEFSRMNLETINILELIAGWTESALIKSRQMSEVKSKNIEDDLTLAYKYDYFKKRMSEEFKRAQRYNFDLSTLLVKLTNYSSIPADRQPEILRLLSIFLKTIVRDVDIVSRFKDENFLSCLLPSTDEKGVLILIKRINAALPAFLKNASLAGDSIKLDYNYKVLFHKK